MQRPIEGCMIRRIGRIFLHIDDKHINDAEDWIKKAIEADKKNGTMWSLGRDYAVYSELLGRKGDQSKAEAIPSESHKNLTKNAVRMDGWIDMKRN